MSSTGNLVACIALSYLDTRKGDAGHADILKVFNTVKPHGYTAKPSDPWCAEFYSACQILAGNLNAPLSASCSQIIADAKAKGEWVENEAVTPKVGWGVIYDWQDSGVGDNKGAPDHIGTVYDVDDSYIHVVEGNMGGGVVGKRAVLKNGRYLRGFVKPDYKPLEKSKYKPLTKYTGNLPTGVVRYGNEGENVKRVQTFVNWALGIKLKVDGKAGARTTEAVITFQYTYGLKPTGNFGAKTRATARKLIKRDPLQPWYEAIKKQYEWSKDQAYKWTTPTIRSSRIKGTCITFPAVALQRLDLLPSGGYVFWDKDINAVGGSVKFIKAHPNTFKLWYPNKTWDKAKLKKGDIVMYDNHTMIFAGTDSKGRARWSTMGRAKRGLRSLYPIADKKKIKAVIRLKRVVL